MGAHADQTHPLNGMLDELEVWHEALDAAAIRRLLCGGEHAAELHARALVRLSWEARARVRVRVRVRANPNPNPNL